MKLIDLIVIVILLGIAALAIRYIVKRRKSGHPIGCTGNCNTCHLYCEHKELNGGNENEQKEL